MSKLLMAHVSRIHPLVKRHFHSTVLVPPQLRVYSFQSGNLYVSERTSACGDRLDDEFVTSEAPPSLVSSVCVGHTDVLWERGATPLHPALA